MARSAPPIVVRSTSEPFLIAEITPTVIPMTIQMRKAPTVSEIVAGSRVKICELTETLFWYE